MFFVSSKEVARRVHHFSESCRVAGDVGLTDYLMYPVELPLAAFSIIITMEAR